MRTRTKGALKLVGLCLVVAPTLTTGTTTAAFTSRATDAANSFTAEPDWVGPPVNGAMLQKTEGYTGGFLRTGGTYRIYANIGPDSGNPAAGIATVTANVSGLTTGQTAVVLSTSGGPWTVNGVSYAYRNASDLTAGTLANVNYVYSVTATDADTPTGNFKSVNFNVTGDVTRPNDIAINSTNGGSIVGRMEQGDTLVLTFDEPIEPQTILAGWDGTSTNVVVRVTNGTGGGPANNDHIEIWDAASTTQLPLGRVRTGSNGYITAPATYGTFGLAGSATLSTMVLTSSTTLTFTFGTAAGTYATIGNASMTWRSGDSPSAGVIIDRAGNTVTAGNLAESGASDPNF